MENLNVELIDLISKKLPEAELGAIKRLISSFEELQINYSNTKEELAKIKLDFEKLDEEKKSLLSEIDRHVKIQTDIKQLKVDQERLRQDREEFEKDRLQNQVDFYKEKSVFISDTIDKILKIPQVRRDIQNDLFTKQENINGYTQYTTTGGVLRQIDEREV